MLVNVVEVSECMICVCCFAIIINMSCFTNYSSVDIMLLVLMRCIGYMIGGLFVNIIFDLNCKCKIWL